MTMQKAIDAATPSQALTTRVHRAQLKDLLVRQSGRFVGIEFTKKDGSVRSLNGRLGVVKHLRGPSGSTDRLDLPYITVYDVTARGYPSVNMATVSKVRAVNTDFAIIS
jgi:hypothetical protein